MTQNSSNLGTTKPNDTHDNYKSFAEENEIRIRNCEILDDTLNFSIDMFTLHNAQMRYPKLKYPSEAKKGYLGIVKHDPEFGFVFFLVKFNGLPLK